MENNNSQRKVITIIFIVLGFIVLITILLSLLIKDEKTPSNNETPGSSNISDDRINKEITKLNDENIFFTLQDIINDYYDLLGTKDKEKIYSILESDYLNLNNITKDNVLEKIKTDFNSTTYVPRLVYFNDNSSTTYYFLNGYFTDLALDGHSNNFEENVNYLIIIDKEKKYVIRPLESNINIETFAKNYNIESIDIDNIFKYPEKRITIENKLSLYIDNFMDIMFFKTEIAYNMLDDDTKEYFGSFDNFNNEVFNIYEKYTSKIFSYHISEEDGKKVYYVIDDNQNRITIYEDYVMDYKISFSEN